MSSKGGVQLTDFEIDVNDYEENRHFFLAHQFRSNYDAAMSQLPNVASGITINRIEIWTTNKTGTTTNTRNIVALTDLGEHDHISNPLWTPGVETTPANGANSLYATLVGPLNGARQISQTTATLDAAGLEGGKTTRNLKRHAC